MQAKNLILFFLTGCSVGLGLFGSEKKLDEGASVIKKLWGLVKIPPKNWPTWWAEHQNEKKNCEEFQKKAFEQFEGYPQDWKLPEDWCTGPNQDPLSTATIDQEALIKELEKVPLSVLKRLFEVEVLDDVENPEQETFFICVCRKRLWEVALCLVFKAPSDVDLTIVDKQGSSAIHYLVNLPTFFFPISDAQRLIKGDIYDSASKFYKNNFGDLADTECSDIRPLVDRVYPELLKKNRDILNKTNQEGRNVIGLWAHNGNLHVLKDVSSYCSPKQRALIEHCDNTGNNCLHLFLQSILYGTQAVPGLMNGGKLPSYRGESVVDLLVEWMCGLELYFPGIVYQLARQRNNNGTTPLELIDLIQGNQFCEWRNPFLNIYFRSCFSYVWSCASYVLASPKSKICALFVLGLISWCGWKFLFSLTSPSLYPLPKSPSLLEIRMFNQTAPLPATSTL